MTNGRRHDCLARASTVQDTGRPGVICYVTDGGWSERFRRKVECIPVGTLPCSKDHDVCIQVRVYHTKSKKRVQLLPLSRTNAS